MKREKWMREVSANSAGTVAPIFALRGYSLVMDAGRDGAGG